MTRTEKQTTRRLPIGRILLIAFIVTPIIEIAVLIQVGGWLGLWPTLALIILTAIAGTWMLRQQGFAVLSRAQSQLERGTVPLAEVFEGICLVVAGALLLTPGFVTDVIGGALLLPPFRTWLYNVLGSRFRASVSYHEGRMDGEPWDSERPPNGGQGQDADGGGPVVEGDFETMPPEDVTSDDDGPPDRSAGSMPPPRGNWGNKP
jgi:UPF0716 protein FxsA